MRPQRRRPAVKATAGSSVAIRRIARSDRNVIIVVTHDDAMTGLMVDSLSDIVTLTEDDLQTPPDMTTNGSAGIVRELSLIDERMVRVLDLAATIGTAKGIAA